jgi:hypothetical protein
LEEEGEKSRLQKEVIGELGRMWKALSAEQKKVGCEGSGKWLGYRANERECYFGKRMADFRFLLSR